MEWPDLGWIGTAMACLCGLLLAAAMIVQRDGPTGMMALFAILPCLESAAVSLWSGRPILLDRYLLFAHVFYLAGLACLAACLSAVLRRLLLILSFGSLILGHVLWERPPLENRAQELTRALEVLCREYDDADILLVSEPTCAVHLWYRLAQRPVEIPVRVIGHQLSQGGHQVHAAAVRSAEWIAPTQLADLQYRRIWVVGRYRSSWVYPASWHELSSTDITYHPADARWFIRSFSGIARESGR